MSASNRPIRVALLWHSPRAENLGIGALTVAHCAIIQSAAAKANRVVEVKAFGWGGELDYSDESEGLTRTEPLRRNDLFWPGSEFFRSLMAADLVLDIGGGDSFTDIYGWKRFCYLSWTKILTLLVGRRLVLSPQTIGPFRSKLTRFLASNICSRATKVFTRDGLSTAALDDLGVVANVVETSDVAFRLPYDAACGKFSEDDGRIHVGLNVSGLLYSGGYTRDNQFGLASDYPDLIELMIREANSNGKIRLHLIGHVFPSTDSREDDLEACSKLHLKFPDTVLAPRFDSPSEAKTYIARLDFLAGARMHATIAAASSNVAVFPMAYSRKFKGVFGSIGYKSGVDLTEASKEEVVKKFSADLADLPRLSNEAKEAHRQAVDYLSIYEDFLTERFCELKGNRR